MDCPACGEILAGHILGQLTADVCQRSCGGVWLNATEIDLIDESHEQIGEQLMALEPERPRPVDHSRKRECPRCSPVVMMRRFWSPRRSVEIDECPHCRGIWIDVGELAMIRAEYPTADARKAATQALFDELFGSELEEMTADSAEKRARTARRLASALRYLSPSYYIPGKQDWGAH